MREREDVRGDVRRIDAPIRYNSKQRFNLVNGLNLSHAHTETSASPSEAAPRSNLLSSASLTFSITGLVLYLGESRPSSNIHELLI